MTDPNQTSVAINGNEANIDNSDTTKNSNEINNEETNGNACGHAILVVCFHVQPIRHYFFFAQTVTTTPLFGTEAPLTSL